jgi:hypothetical protein
MQNRFRPLLYSISAIGTGWCSIVGAAHAAPLASFVPEGYRINVNKKADFNADGIQDALLVLVSEKDKDAPRPLVILFGEGKGQYKLSLRNDEAIPETGSGGAAQTDGFAGVALKGTGFVIRQEGGSSVRNLISWQFRFQANKWLLIGETIETGGIGVKCPHWKNNFVDCESWKLDTNFLTGRQELTHFTDGEGPAGRKQYVRQLKTIVPIALEKFSATPQGPLNPLN